MGGRLDMLLGILGGSFNFVVPSYQSSKCKPILTISVRSMAVVL